MAIKIAFGTIKTPFSFNINQTTRDVIQNVKNIVKNVISVESNERIEIVLGKDIYRCELQDKISETDNLFWTITTETSPLLYARIICVVGNTEYIKTHNNGIRYFKKEDLTNDILETPYITHNQMQRLQNQPLQTCTICYERTVSSVHHYSCSHLFCNTCATIWSRSCALCRST